MEENHYYAYGLKISAISSRKLGSSLEGQLKNAYLYNGKELFEDAELNWYDYGFRNYDPQIGRFPQLDPLTFEFPFYTPYQYAGCEPIANVDLDGLEPLNVVGKVGDAIVTGASVMSEVVVTSTKVARTAGITGKVATISAKVLLQVSNVAVNRSESTCVGCAEANRRMQMANEIRDINNMPWQDRPIPKQAPVNFSPLKSEAQKRADAIKETYGEALEYMPGVSDISDFTNLVDALRKGDIKTAMLYGAFLLPGGDLLKVGKPLLKGTAKTIVKALKFGGDEAVEHFGKHADQIMKVTRKSEYNLKNYVDDANWIIQNGTYSSKLNGYYHYMGNSSKGESLFGFVGLKNGGENISTFHIKSATELGLK